MSFSSNLIGNTMNFHEISELLETKFNFDYVEHEGPDVIRHDIGDNSFWINADCTFENLETFPKAFQTTIAKLLA